MDTNGMKTICEALHSVMEKVGYVQKGSVNEFHRYKYASEGDLLSTLRPAMVEAGLMLIPSQTQHSAIDDYGNVIVEMEYTLCHSSGAVWPEKIRAIGCGNDKNSKGGVGDKGIYKAITGANKYLLFKLFQIETGDDPEATDNGDTATKETKQAKHQTPPENNGNGAAQARAEQNVQEVFGGHEVEEDPKSSGGDTISPAQVRRLFAKGYAAKLSENEIVEFSVEETGYKPSAMPWKVYKGFCEKLDAMSKNGVPAKQHEDIPF